MPTPQRPPAPPAPTFVPATPAERAVRTLLTALLDTLEAHLPGTLAGRDPEQLHDLRVAARRSRTLLGELGEALPRRARHHVRRQLRALSLGTSPQRDLDVLLERLLSYAEQPGVDAAGLRPTVAVLWRRRAAAHRALVALLRDPATARLRREWRAALRRSWADRAPGASLPAAELARVSITRAHARLLADGRAMGASPPVEAVHALRIDAKKLRYLLEQFAPLYAPERVKPLVKALKKLQDTLGGCQDARVQLALLDAVALGFHARPPRQEGAFAALRHLQATLQAEQDEYRAAFTRRFATFARTVSVRAVRSLVVSAAG